MNLENRTSVGYFDTVCCLVEWCRPNLAKSGADNAPEHALVTQFYIDGAADTPDWSLDVSYVLRSLRFIIFTRALIMVNGVVTQSMQASFSCSAPGYAP